MKRTLLALMLALPLTGFAQRNVWFSWVSKDVHYAQTLEPARPVTNDTTLTAWRGERAGMQALIYAPQATGPLKLRLSDWRGPSTISSAQGWARFISYVTTDGHQACGYPDHSKLAAYEVPDVIETEGCQSLTQQTARPVWCTFEVPRDARPGNYRVRLELLDSASGKMLRQLSLTLRVNERTLPAPHDQQFHVDFWQQPYAVSRYLGLKRWSPEHYEALKPYLRLLARSGQRVASVILFYEPWGEQSEDKFDPMIRTTRRADGSWSYDYTLFDRWVELCAECGIDKGINCFSMVPWDMTFNYFDEATHSQVSLRTGTDSPEYAELWKAFLKSFAQHLKAKGWYDKTCIAMDERGLTNMLDAYRVAQEAVPGIRMALAGSYHKELVDKLADYCIGFGEYFTDEELATRRAKGWLSTTYNCCSTPAPNVFTNSLPAEAVYLPLFCTAHNFDGYLHWSWMNWPKDPLHDSRFRMFAPGDTYLIYPGPRSSVRYERFLEGVAAAEKVRILREEYKSQGNDAALQRLNALLKNFEEPRTDHPATVAAKVNEIEAELNR